MHGAQHCTGARIDQVDQAQVPAGITQLNVGQLAVLGRYLKALPGQAERSVGAALAARHLDAKRLCQGRRARALARNVGAAEVALERRGADLRMVGAVVFLLHPGLGGLVEQFQRQGLVAFEHGHQAPFDTAPEGFLLGVLVG